MLFLEPSEIAPHLPLIRSQYHKLIIPEKEETKLNEDVTDSQDALATSQNASSTEEKLVESSVYTTDTSIT